MRLAGCVLAIFSPFVRAARGLSYNKLRAVSSERERELQACTREPIATNGLVQGYRLAAPTSVN